MRQGYDPNRHRRRSIRLGGWDYTAVGAYFVTICTHGRENLFDYAPYRELAVNAWRRIPDHPRARHVTLDECVVMPNHVHGIIFLDESAGRETVDGGGDEVGGGDGAGDGAAMGAAPGSVGAIMGNFKSLVATRINRLRHTSGAPVWQRGYYDRIIRSDRELDAIRRYIRDNPERWAQDRDNLDVLIARMRYVDGEEQ